MGKPEDLTAKPLTEADVRRIIREMLPSIIIGVRAAEQINRSQGLPSPVQPVSTIFLRRLRAFVDNPTDPIQGAHTIRLGLLVELDRLLSS